MKGCWEIVFTRNVHIPTDGLTNRPTNKRDSYIASIYYVSGGYNNLLMSFKGTISHMRKKRKKKKIVKNCYYLDVFACKGIEICWLMYYNICTLLILRRFFVILHCNIYWVSNPVNLKISLYIYQVITTTELKISFAELSFLTLTHTLM